MLHPTTTMERMPYSGSTTQRATYLNADVVIAATAFARLLDIKNRRNQCDIWQLCPASQRVVQDHHISGPSAGDQPRPRAH